MVINQISFSILREIRINTGINFNYVWMLECFTLRERPPETRPGTVLGLSEFTCLKGRLKLTLWGKFKQEQ